LISICNQFGYAWMSIIFTDQTDMIFEKKAKVTLSLRSAK